MKYFIFIVYHSIYLFIMVYIVASIRILWLVHIVFIYAVFPEKKIKLQRKYGARIHLYVDLFAIVVKIDVSKRCAGGVNLQRIRSHLFLSNFILPLKIDICIVMLALSLVQFVNIFLSKTSNGMRFI